MTEILFSVRLSVFCWSMLGRGSFSAAFLLPCPEKGVVWSIPRWTHPTRIAVVALVLTDLVSISGNAATGRATWRHLSSSTVLFTTNEHLDKTHQYQQQKLSDLIRPPLLHPALNVVYFFRWIIYICSKQVSRSVLPWVTEPFSKWRGAQVHVKKTIK